MWLIEDMFCLRNRESLAQILKSPDRVYVERARSVTAHFTFALRRGSVSREHWAMSSDSTQVLPTSAPAVSSIYGVARSVQKSPVLPPRPSHERFTQVIYRALP